MTTSVGHARGGQTLEEQGMGWTRDHEPINGIDT